MLHSQGEGIFLPFTLREAKFSPNLQSAGSYAKLVTKKVNPVSNWEKKKCLFFE